MEDIKQEKYDDMRKNIEEWWSKMKMEWRSNEGWDHFGIIGF